MEKVTPGRGIETDECIQQVSDMSTVTESPELTHSSADRNDFAGVSVHGPHVVRSLVFFTGKGTANIIPNIRSAVSVRKAGSNLRRWYPRLR